MCSKKDLIKNIDLKIGDVMASIIIEDALGYNTRHLKGELRALYRERTDLIASN